MTDPRVVPGDDGAGVVDEVGKGVDAARLGQRVWIHFANYLRPFGTMAEYVDIPAARAVELPEIATFAAGACLGVPALTAHRSVHADGSVADKIVVVTGCAGAVGRYAIGLAKAAGAYVVATASAGGARTSAPMLSLTAMRQISPTGSCGPRKDGA